MGFCQIPNNDRLIGRLIRQSLRCRTLSDLIQWTVSDPCHLSFCKCLVDPKQHGDDGRVFDRIGLLCKAKNLDLNHLQKRFAPVGKALGLARLSSCDPLTEAHATLGISQGATVAEIKKAFRSQAKKLHPDSGSRASDSLAFGKLCNAYRELVQQTRRGSDFSPRLDGPPYGSANQGSIKPAVGSIRPWRALFWSALLLIALGFIALLVDASMRGAVLR